VDQTEGGPANLKGREEFRGVKESRNQRGLVRTSKLRERDEKRGEKKEVREESKERKVTDEKVSVRVLKSMKRVEKNSVIINLKGAGKTGWNYWQQAGEFGGVRVI